MVCGKIEVPARADVGIGPYEGGRSGVQNRMVVGMENLTKKRRLAHGGVRQPFLGVAGEFFAAFGAADVDFSAVAGDAHGLLAVRAAEIAVVAVGHAEAEVLPALIFPLAAVDIAREHAENGEAEQRVHQQREDRPEDEGIDPTAAQEKREDARNKAQRDGRDQKDDIELV